MFYLYHFNFHRCFSISLFISIAIPILVFTDPTVAQTKRRSGQKSPPQPVVMQPKKVILAAPETSEPLIFGLTVERYRNDIVVESDGTSVQTWDILQRATSVTGLSTIKKVERVYNGDLEEIEITDAYVLKADGRKIPLPAGSIQKKRTPQSEAAPAFSSLMMIEVVFDELAVGDAAHYRCIFRTKRTHFDGHFDKLDYLAAVFDWKDVEITLSAPVGYPVYVQTVDLDGGRLPDEGKRSRWRWTKSNAKAIELEPMMTDLVEISPRIMMTSFRDFDELGSAYWKAAAKKAEVTPDIKVRADEITRNISTPEAQAAAIYLWVNKNIRYLSLVLDRNGWVPHDASQILSNGYGDCKDYSTILKALLKAKGIESYPVIIRADMGTWFPNVAVPAFFNHAMLYIPSLDLFADATSPNTRLGLIPQQITGKKAFLAGERTGVIETHSNRPDENQVLSKIDLELSPTGDIRAKSVNTYIGRSEILFRPMYTESVVSQDGFVGAILAFYGMVGKGKITKKSDPFRVGDPFEVEINVELDNYTTVTPTGSFRLPIALNFNNILSLADLVKPTNRRTNLLVGAVRLVESYRIRFPEGVEIQRGLLTDSGISNGVGSFKNEYKLKEHGVELLREIVISNDTITPAEYPLIRELLTKASEAFQTEIKYSAPSTFLTAKSKLVAKSPVPTANPWQRLLTDEANRFKKVTPSEAKRLEALLLKTPGDVSVRIRLISYYSPYGVSGTKRQIADRTRHRLWLIENRPEIADEDLPGFRFAVLKRETPEYALLKSAWRNKIDAEPSNARIRINAFQFLNRDDEDLAIGLIQDGMKADPENYELPLTLQKFYNGDPFSQVKETPEQKIVRLRNEVKYGEAALALLKKERSTERDTVRRYLLQSIAKTAFEISEYQRAGMLAQELVLDFGNDAGNVGYDDAAHIGNIILGRIELRRKNVEKAKEYLLIAIRAPLRKANSWLSEIDMVLARELFEAGEKDAVIDYLKLCEGLSNLTTEKKLFENQSRALKLWQEQIRQGKTPSFDFYKL